MPTLAEVQEVNLEEPKTLQELAASIINVIRKSNPNPVLFDLGCGRKKFAEFTGVDFYLDTDVKHDLIAGDWSFTPDSSVDMFLCSHFLEHVGDLNGFMEKAWRKMKGGGFFLINTPFGNSVRAWQDPDHKRPIFRETYWYFNAEARKKMGVDHYEGNADFDLVEMWPVWNKDFANKSHEAQIYALEHTWNAVDDLTVLMRAIKGSEGPVDDDRAIPG